jgi:predicted nucleic acid-binding protein
MVESSPTRFSKLREVMVIAEKKGLLRSNRTQLIRGGMPEALVERARKRTGIVSDTKLIKVALANIAVAEDYSGWLLSRHGLSARQIVTSEFQGIVGRFKPEKDRARLRPRAESELEFLGTTSHLPTKLLYDTTVYVDILQGRFPQQGEAMLRATEDWHSPVTEAELAASYGLLDPAQPQTAAIIEQIAAVIDRRSSYRTITPDPEIWREAGVLSGTLARTQGYGTEHRRRVLNDALLFASARKHGCAVLSRDVRDFELLQQIDPSGRVVFYKIAAP